MKAIFKITILALSMAFVACNDNYLDRKPIDKLYDGNFWRSPGDLELYCNGFYTPDMFPYMLAWKPLPLILEQTSDNIISKYEIDPMAAGLRIVPGSGAGWSISKTMGDITTDDWRTIRACNVFLKQYKTATGDEALIKHYVGVIRFFRAMDYFKKVTHFGDVPWFGEPLNINSEELVSQKRDPRALVMDSVLADLNFAVANCLPPTNGNLQHSAVNLDVVNAYKSRICLFEGTYRKYHKLDGSTKFLQAAAEASEAVMQTTRYNIWKGAGDPKRNYQELFWQVDIYGTKECIMGQEYILPKTYQTLTGDAPYETGGMSIWFVRSYLKADGTPFPANLNQTWEQEVTGRDPRLAQTITTPGYIWYDAQAAYLGDTVTIASTIWNIDQERGIRRDYSCNTGYNMIKWCMKTLEQRTTGNGNNGFMMMRYAEVLLNFAEAKAELNNLTQADLDGSINLLRDRVGMPPMSIAPVHDPYSDWVVAGISPLPSDLIIEIRRERRVELVAEGLRRDDLMRWKAGKLMELPVLGVKYVPSDYKENNFPDIALIPDVNIFVEANLRFSPWKMALPQGRKFDENKDYLWPIPTDVITKSNGGIIQNPGW